MRTRLFLAAALLLSQPAVLSAATMPKSMNDAAQRYVKLVLALGEHDADYVDAYYGPAKWRDAVRKEKPSVSKIYDRALVLERELDARSTPSDSLAALRLEYLRKQVSALLTRAEMLEGRKLSFDDEARALYDAEVPRHEEQYFKDLTAALERELPGDGALIDRLEQFRARFVIPKEKHDAVFKAAIEACRARTMEYIALPKSESFKLEYVTNKSWSGYNWYQGKFNSLIQMNTDLPIFIDRAIDLACHEGYPGHHVYNVLLEKHLVRDRGWVEFSVYPLFSPQSLIAEGSANYGIEVAFPAQERLEFEKKTLFPLAGLDPATAEQYYRVQDLAAKTSYAGNEAARRYLNGDINAAQAADWLVRYGLMGPDRAKQRVKFIDQYRAYVINYNLGKDLVRAYVERKSGGDAQKRWDVFEELLSSPRLPSGLKN